MIFGNIIVMSKKNKIRVRLAPSPTGPFHIGTARTALFNYLFAKKHKGDFVLRVEDTDIERSKPEYEEDIVQGLKWLNIKYDEIYKQSQRKKIYKKYLKKLLDSGQAYKKEIIWFKNPNKKVIFNDEIRGKIEFDSSEFKDFSLAKDLETPLYNFAVVIDDYDMKISHVIRGEDHISNTPKQILIYEALGLKPPKFAHLPLILGPDKSKLSKRNFITSINDYKKLGYLPEALINFMALLGWSAQSKLANHNIKEREIFSIKELIKEFSIKKVQKGGAIFDIEKLNWFNGYYIRQESIEKLTKLCIPYLVKDGLIKPKFKSKQYPPAFGGYSIQENYVIAQTNEKITVKKLEKIIILEQKRIKKLSEISELTKFFFEKKLEYNPDILKWKDMNKKELKNIFDKLENILSKIKEEDFTQNNLTKILFKESEKLASRGELLWPLRAALSGKKASPSPFEIAEVLGKEKTLDRIKQAKNKVSK